MHAPPQPPKIDPPVGVAVSDTEVPGAKVAEQVLPQLTPAGALVTVPVPVPAFVTTRVLLPPAPVMLASSKMFFRFSTVALSDQRSPASVSSTAAFLPNSKSAVPAAFPRDMLEERTDGAGQSWLELAIPAERFIDQYGVRVTDHLSLLVMGQPSHGGSG